MHVPDPRAREDGRRCFSPFIGYFRNCRSVLDVASGQGHSLELFKEAGINATGVEVDRDLCELSRQKGLQIVHSDFFKYLPAVPAGTFDGALVSHIVEHFTPLQVEELLKLLWRAVTPGAVLVIITPNIANLRRAAGDFWRDPTHVRPYPAQALAKLLRRTSWETVLTGEHSKRSPSLRRQIVYAIRNLFFGKYWVKDDVFVVARRLAESLDDVKREAGQTG
jgi:SAM-dependent methyltransferase